MVNPALVVQDMETARDMLDMGDRAAAITVVQTMLDDSTL